MVDKTSLQSESIAETTSDTNAADYEALKAFLLDISCLDPLSEWTDRFNLFDVLKLSQYEIRHSNLLAWLLNPNETHGLGSLFLEAFIKRALRCLEEEKDVFEVLLMDFQTVSVFREWHNIDILAVSETKEFVLCIENKYGSKEHDNQLNRYRETVSSAFPNFKKMFIFLSPDGGESSSPDYWYSMSYAEILSIIQNIKCRVVLRPEVEMLINQYEESVRRDIMGEEDLTRICQEIYSKHQRALDLLFLNRPDKMSDIANVFRKWANKKTQEGVLSFDEAHSDKINTRLKTKEMDRLFPDLDSDSSLLSRWGSKSQYYYEIQQTADEKKGNQYRISFVVNSTNMTEENKAVCKVLDHMSKESLHNHRINWQIKTYYSTARHKIGDDIDEDSIFQTLDHLWDEVMKQEDRIVAACQNKSEIPSASND